jgi:hypothetical protein
VFLYIYIYIYIYIYTLTAAIPEIRKLSSHRRSPAFLPEHSTSLPIRSRHRKLTSGCESTPRPHIASCKTTWSTCKRGSINQSIHQWRELLKSEQQSLKRKNVLKNATAPGGKQATKHACMRSERKKTNTNTQILNLNQSIEFMFACKHVGT